MLFWYKPSIAPRKKTITLDDLTKKRLMLCHQRVKEVCGSQPHFYGNLLVDRRHIDKRAATEPDSLRLNIGDEQIASVILNGKLNEERSRINGSLAEIVVEGIFRQFPWIDLKDNNREKIEEAVCVRVIVREGGRRYVVVTAYVPRHEALNPDDFIEVAYEIW